MLVMSDHLNRMLRDHTLHVCAGQVAASDEAARHVYIVRYKGIERVYADLLHAVLYMCVQCA